MVMGTHVWRTFPFLYRLELNKVVNGESLVVFMNGQCIFLKSLINEQLLVCSSISKEYNYNVCNNLSVIKGQQNDKHVY